MSTTATKDLTPVALTRMLLGFCRSRLLMSAVEVGLFGLLASGGRTDEELRGELNLHPRVARDFLDALVSLGVLDKDGDQYTNGELADRYLVPAKPSFIGGFIELAADLQWTAWSRLTRALRTGEMQVSTVPDAGAELFRTPVVKDPDRIGRFMTAMDSHSTRIGAELAQRVDWSKYSNFADIGGARGNLAARIVIGQPQLRGVCFDRAASEPFFREHIESLGVAGKVTFQAGDFFTDPLPAADVLIFGHVLHDWDPETRKLLIRRAYQALHPGGALIIYDRMINDQLSDPDVLLLSLTFTLTSAGGSEYRVAECQKWLQDTGFKDITAIPILENHTFILAHR